VYLVGHSQGGMMALSVLLLRPDLIDGCAVLNARILPEALERRSGGVAIDGVPVFVGHSVGDTVVPSTRDDERGSRWRVPVRTSPTASTGVITS